MTSEGNKALLPTYPRMLTAREIYYKFVHEKVLLRGLYNKSLEDWSLGEKQFILFPSNLNIEILRNSFSTSLKVKIVKTEASFRDLSESLTQATIERRSRYVTLPS